MTLTWHRQSLPYCPKTELDIDLTSTITTKLSKDLTPNDSPQSKFDVFIYFCLPSPMFVETLSSDVCGKCVFQYILPTWRTKLQVACSDSSLSAKNCTLVYFHNLLYIVQCFLFYSNCRLLKVVHVYAQWYIDKTNNILMHSYFFLTFYWFLFSFFIFCFAVYNLQTDTEVFISLSGGSCYAMGTVYLSFTFK